MTHSELCFVACRWLASINRKYLAALFREFAVRYGGGFGSRIASGIYGITGHDHRLGKGV